VLLVLVFFSAGAAVPVQSLAGRPGAPMTDNVRHRDAAPLHAQTAPSSTPPLTPPEEITVAPSVAAVSPHTEFQAPATAQAEANVQPLTADDGNGSKRELLYGAAAVAAFLAVILLIVAVRGGGRSRQK